MIKFIKPAADGIGTGGIAWALFGVVFATVNLQVAGLAAIIAGSMSIGLFVLVAMAAAYFSYTAFRDENEQLENNHLAEQENLDLFLNTYFFELMRYYIIKNKLTDFSQINNHNALKFFLTHVEKIKRDRPDHPIVTIFNDEALNITLFDNFITTLKNQTAFTLDAMINTDRKETLIRNHCQDLLQPHTKTFVVKLYNEPVSPPKTRNYLFCAFSGFCAGFGTIVGGSAGIGGLLGGLGLFAGFASLPILGWCLLAAAVILGTIFAVMGCRYLSKKNRYDEQYMRSKDTQLVLNSYIQKYQTKVCDKKSAMKNTEEITPRVNLKSMIKVPLEPDSSSSPYDFPVYKQPTLSKQNSAPFQLFNNRTVNNPANTIPTRRVKSFNIDERMPAETCDSIPLRRVASYHGIK